LLLQYSKITTLSVLPLITTSFRFCPTHFAHARNDAHLWHNVTSLKSSIILSQKMGR